MNKFLYSFLFIISINCVINAQIYQDTTSFPDEPIRIDSVKIIGNEITQEVVILRELTFEMGDYVDREIINYNRERIYSLDLFTLVKLYLVERNNKNILIISVEESWYIYPIPFAELKDRDWDKISYGLDVVLKNFRGMNETLRGRASFGYDPSFAATYINPWLVPDEDIFLRADVSYTDANNKSTNAARLFGGVFEQKYISGGISLGKRFGIYHRLSFNAGYSYVESPEFIKGINASNGRIDRTIFTGINYTYDTRDLAQFPREGLFFNTLFQFKGMGINNIDYKTFAFDFREYRLLIGDLGAKWRLAGRKAFGGVVPFYDFSYLGLGERIRGHFNREMEGHDRYISSLEFNYPIIQELHLKLTFIPIIPKELLSYRIALFAQIFGDTGTTRDRNEPLKIKDFVSGYGAGLTLLILPYNILRVDFAMDENQNTEWIIDLGISF